MLPAPPRPCQAGQGGVQYSIPRLREAAPAADLNRNQSSGAGAPSLYLDSQHQRPDALGKKKLGGCCAAAPKRPRGRSSPSQVVETVCSKIAALPSSCAARTVA
jgi:hypothetical protein